MLSNFSKSLAGFITKDLNYDEEKNEIVSYAIEMFLLGVVGFLAILLLGFVFNALLPAAIAAISGGVLRRVSGGAHFDTPLKCLGLGAIIYSLIGVLANYLLQVGSTNWINMIFILLCLIIVFLFAPVDSEAKPIHSQTLRNKLRLSSVLFIIFILIFTILNDNLLINISAMLGILYQSLTLLPIFNKGR